MKLLEYIFSVKNEKQHKVLRLFGIKLKFKRKAKTNEIHETSVPVIELFLQQYSNNKFNRLDTIVRLLAIENYYNKNDCGWDLYSKMQDKRMGKGFSIGARERFKNLITSWESNDYDTDSRIVVDKNMKLIDGSHRLALALYHNTKNISLTVKNIDKNPFYQIEWFIEHDFSPEEISIILNRLKQLEHEYNSTTICCALWAPVYKYFDEITQKLSLLYNIKEVKDVEFSDDTYSRMVKAIYSTDDIAKWKIEKKLGYMADFYPKVIRFINIEVKQPLFRFKKSNYHTILTQGELLKKIIRNCYKDKIDNYFYDICFHTCDNTTQSEFVNKLWHADLHLEEYFNEISKYNYMIIKFETENMTKDFPKTFPFSKDIDLVCTTNDFYELKTYTAEYFKKHTNFEIRIIDDSDYHTRIRIEHNKFLIYQIDISKKINGITDNFIDESLKRKELKNSFYLPSLEDELIFRAAEYANHPNKNQHLNYIKKHLGYFNDKILNMAVDENLYDAIKEKISM